MVSDSSIVNASSAPHNQNNNAPKDFAKKKRVNRTAKLKQCKLDARREQWLSQVKNSNNKGSSNSKEEEKKGPPPEIETRSKRKEEVELEVHIDSDSESPTSCLSGGGASSSSCGASTSSGSSRSSYSGGDCFSGCITEEDVGGGEEEEEDEGLDDWEAVADALAADMDAEKGHNGNNVDGGVKVECEREEVGRGNGNVGECEKEKGILGKGGVGSATRAWRADDVCRPQSLPNLAKQRSFPVNSERMVGVGANPWMLSNNVPSSCPICCEDLDKTDSSFLPCYCGFRLCLFCYNRICEEGDGRCPGCRKQYSLEPVQKEENVSGGSLTIQLTRSFSMFERV